MKIEMVMALKEAYFSSQDNEPTLILTGVQIGKGGHGVEGPISVTLQGNGIRMVGLKLGELYSVLIEPQGEAPVNSHGVISMSKRPA